MKNREQIGNGAMIALLFLSTALSTLTVSGKDAPMLTAVAPICFLSVLPVIAVYAGLERTGVPSLPERLQKTVPKPIALLLTAAYVLFFLGNAAFSVADYQSFLQEELLPEMPGAVLCGMILFAAAYGARMGIRALARASVFFFVGSVTVIGLLFLLLIRRVDLLNLPRDFAFFTESCRPAAVQYFAILPELPLSLLLAPKVSRPKRSLLLWTGCSAVLLGLSGFFLTAVLGKFAENLPNPFYQMAGLAEFGHLQRWDVLCLAVWTFAVFVRVSLMLAAAVQCLAPYRSVPIWAIGILTGVCSFLPGILHLQALRTQLQPIVTVVLSIGVPAGLCCIRPRKELS